MSADCCQSRVSRCLRGSWLRAERSLTGTGLRKRTPGGCAAGDPPTWGAVCVLQAEAGFVPLSHLGAVESEEVIVCEDLDAVVVPAGREALSAWSSWQARPRRWAPSLSRGERYRQGSALLPHHARIPGTMVYLLAPPAWQPGTAALTRCGPRGGGESTALRASRRLVPSHEAQSEAGGRGTSRNEPRASGPICQGGVLTLLPGSLRPNCYHCFQSRPDDNSVPATGEGAYYLSKAKSQRCCLLHSAFPTHAAS